MPRATNAVAGAGAGAAGIADAVMRRAVKVRSPRSPASPWATEQRPTTKQRPIRRRVPNKAVANKHVTSRLATNAGANLAIDAGASHHAGASHNAVTSLVINAARRRATATRGTGADTKVGATTIARPAAATTAARSAMTAAADSDLPTR